MIRQYRQLKYGEHVVIGADTAQGGADECFAQFLSKTKIDVPIVHQLAGVAAQMTVELLPILERIHDITGVKPTIAIERQNGGTSEMERLQVLNRHSKYDLYVMPKIGQALEMDDEPDTKKLGWDTNGATRDMMLGDLKYAINNGVIGLYDDVTLRQLYDFILNRQGKPEAAPNCHDDAVMSLAIAWQLYNRVPTVHPVVNSPQAQPTFDPHAMFPSV